MQNYVFLMLLKTWHETCKYKCRLDASVCYNKQGWNKDKCGCEWKKIIGNGICDKGFTWNSSICEYVCGKSCHEMLENI